MSPVDLKTRTVKDLATLAKKKKIPGWHAMRKEELIKALLRWARSRSGTNGKSPRLKAKGLSQSVAVARCGSKKSSPRRPDSRAKETIKRRLQNPQAQRRPATIRENITHLKDLAIRTEDRAKGHRKDRLVVMVRDPFWLHAYWELSRRTIERARAAMGPHWHAARPVLRLCEIHHSGITTSARKTIRDIPIHGGVNNWYIDVRDPPKTYQIEIGYLAQNGRFLAMARSNFVTTPAVDTGNASFDKNWSEVAKDFDRIYAMSGGYAEQESRSELKEIFEERLNRSMSAQIGPGAMADKPNGRQLSFEVDAELIVHGVTDPGAHVTLRGEPVRLRGDGTFAVRFRLPNRRHILPVVARSKDGVEQRTIVLSIDRNTKVMEPLIREPGE